MPAHALQAVFPGSPIRTIARKAELTVRHPTGDRAMPVRERKGREGDEVGGFWKFGGLRASAGILTR